MSDSVDKLFLDFQGALAGRYSLERELGRGGMGVVYLVRELRLDRPVAIKLLPPSLAAHPPLRERFLREARIAAQLSHPHIVPIHAVDEVGDFVFYVMAYVEGETLAQRIAARGPLASQEAARLVREVAWALAYAHQKGVVHRDIKSENILLEPETRRALVADFGIASLRDGRGTAGPEDVVGTPAFMSPEQGAGETVDGRSDLYSLGVVAFHALTGELPFTGKTAAAVMGQHLTRPAPAVSDLAPATPEALARVVARCLAKAPNERFQSGEELAGELGGALESRQEVPVAVRAFLRSFPRRVAAIAVGVVALVPIVVGAIDYSVVVGGAIGLGVFLGAWRIAGAAFLEPARRVLRAGHSYDDVVQAVRQDVERRREELGFQYGGEPERWVRGMSWSGLVFGGLILIISLVQSGPQSFAWYDWLVTLGLVGVGGSALLLSARRDLWRELTARLWASTPVRWVFLAAGVTVGPKVPAPSSRTEVALGAAAEALLAGLPRDAQRALGRLPVVVRRIEEQVYDARRGGDDARKSELIAALETIRLDLLRLRAGTGSLESITADLAAAERIGQAADRAIAAQEASALRHA